MLPVLHYAKYEYYLVSSEIGGGRLTEKELGF